MIRFVTSMSPAVRKIVVAAGLCVAVVLLLLLLAGTFHRKIDQSNAQGTAEASVEAGRTLPPNAATEVVRLIRLPATESAVGTIRAVHEATLASKLLAKVVEVNVIAGQKIAKDEVLVRLDDADLRARLQQAQAAADSAKAADEQAKIEFDRIEGLFKRGNAAQIELDRAGTSLKSTEAALRQAEKARDEASTILGYALIRSPIDGTVIDKKVEVGDTVQPGQALLSLYDPTRMQLVASVRESLTHRLKVGQDIGVFVESLGRQCQGNISEIVPEAESASRTFAVKVTGPCPPGIYSGMFGRLLIPLDDQEVLVVPARAVSRIGQLDVVDVVEAATVRRRVVQLGKRHGDSIEVLSGLRENEKVVIETRSRNAPGAPPPASAACEPSGKSPSTRP